MSLDKTKIKPIPTVKTLMLVNNFVVNTTRFFNNFTETIESKISTVSKKITEVEILLSILEAKLNSVPGMEDIDAAASANRAQQAQTTAQATPTEATAAPPTAPPAPAAPAAAPTAQPAAPPAPVAEPEPAPAAPSLADDPEYGPLIRMLKVRVPLHVVQMRATSMGLDPSLLEPFAP